MLPQFPPHSENPVSNAPAFVRRPALSRRFSAKAFGLLALILIVGAPQIRGGAAETATPEDLP